MTCWWCGAKPVEVFEVGTWEGALRLIPHWPPSDHPCAEKPPTADDLFDRAFLQAGWADA